MINEWLEYNLRRVLDKLQFDSFSNLRVRNVSANKLIWQNDVDFAKGTLSANTEISGSDDAALLRLKEIANLDDNIPYTTEGNYTLSDGAKLEITDGVAALKTQTGISQNYPFTISGNYTFNSAEIVVTGGVAKLLGSLTVDLEAYYKMDEASWNGTPGEVTDSSLNSNDGAATGNANTAAGGLFGRLGTWDGNDDSVAIPHHATLSFEKDEAFSFQCWIKVGSGGNRSILSKQQVSGSLGINLQVITAGKLRMNLVGASGSLAVDSANVVDDDTLHHIVVTYDGSEDVSGVHIYIDNNDETLSTVANALAGSIVTAVDFRLGNRENSDQDYDGLMDEVAVWRREVTSTEVTELYNSGTGLELTFFPTTDPTIENNTGLVFTSALGTFVETSTKPAGTAIKYQVSSDDGTTFKWWSGAAWVARTNLSVVTAVSTTVGTVDAGNLASLQTLDASTYDVSEIATNPGFTIEMDMSNVAPAGPDNVVIHGYYDGSHTNVDVDIWDFNTSAWVTLGQIATSGGSVVEQSFAVTGTKADKVEAGVVKIRINHDEMGNAAHNIFLDYVYVDAPPSNEWWYDNETNTEAEVNTNLATLAVSGTFKFNAFLESDSTDTPLLDNILVTSSPIYSTDDNLYIDTKAAAQIDASDVIAWLTAVFTSTIPGSTDIRVLFSNDDRVSWLTWSGSAWVAPASATTRTDATSLTDAAAQIASLPVGSNDTFDMRIFLRTTSVSVTPEMDNLNIVGNRGFQISGNWESNIYDSTVLSQTWGKVVFTVTTPSGSSVTIVAKASNKSNLADTSYGSAYANNEDSNLTGRYIQFKITFAGTLLVRSDLDDIAVTYQTPDLPEVAP